MSEVATVLQLHDLDLLLNEAVDPKSRARLKKLGFEVQDPVVLQRARARLLQGVDRRWVNHYERALKRYGRGGARSRLSGMLHHAPDLGLSERRGVAHRVRVLRAHPLLALKS